MKRGDNNNIILIIVCYSNNIVYNTVYYSTVIIVRKANLPSSLLQVGTANTPKAKELSAAHSNNLVSV